MIRSLASPLLAFGHARHGQGWCGFVLAIAAVLFGSGCQKCAHETPSKETKSELEAIELAVTVDDLAVRLGDAPAETPQEEEAVIKAFLEAFAKHGVPAVYGFVNGKRVDEMPSRYPLLEAWRNAGHPLGNHTHSHSKLGDAAAFTEDIDRGEDVLRRLYGPADERKWKMFRYPNLNEGSGEKRKAVRAHLDGRGYRLAPVTVDFFDYAYADAYARCAANDDQSAIAQLESRFVSSALDCVRGSDVATRKEAGRAVKHVLLLHVGSLQAKLLDRLLGELKAAKVKFISLDDALKDAYLQNHLRPGNESRRACGRTTIAEVKKQCRSPNATEPGDERTDG